MGKLIDSVYILKGTLTKEEYQRAFADIKERLSKYEIKKVEEIGLKKLAYEVKANNTGFYIIIEFYADYEEIKELESYCRNNDNILKWILVKK